MGQSTDAMLFYGYAWDGESDWSEISVEARDLWGNEHPVQIGRHCSGDYPMPYVYVTATESRAYRGSVVDIDIDLMQNEGLWDAQLAKFCKDYAIDVDGKVPGWHLVSYWG